MRLAFAALLSLTVGCAVVDGLGGGDGEDRIGDPPVGDDGGVANPAQFLGVGCNIAAPNCPAGLTCASFTDLGSTIEGWCTPVCDMNNINDPTCTNGFPGPGDPLCAPDGVGTGGLCIIFCDVSFVCPPDLTCTFAPDPDDPQFDTSICTGDN